MVSCLNPKNNARLDLLGLYTLFLLLIISPFHFIVYQKWVYYREIIAVIFVLLTCFKLQVLWMKGQWVKKGTLLALLFPFMLIFFAVIDSGKNLYNADYTGASLHLRTVSPDLYVLRNAFLYLPMVVYFSFRGFLEREIRHIAILVIVVAVVAIFKYLYHYHLATFMTFGSLIELSGAGLQYNSYVPSLTFPVLSALYLLDGSHVNRLIKIMVFCMYVFLSVYILLSVSRQSSLFMLICAGAFFVKSRETRFKQKCFLAVAYVLCTVTAFQLVTAPYRASEKMAGYLSSFSECLKTPRLELAKQGLLLLKPSEYFTGAGLASVINSGPHNDYIRWIQRIGLVGMIMGFLPYLYALLISNRRAECDEKNGLSIYLFLSIVFTLYHSLFGYPREDCYQSLYSFLGLALVGGYWKGAVIQLSFGEMHLYCSNFFARFLLLRSNRSLPIRHPERSEGSPMVASVPHSEISRCARDDVQSVQKS